MRTNGPMLDPRHMTSSNATIPTRMPHAYNVRDRSQSCKWQAQRVSDAVSGPVHNIPQAESHPGLEGSITRASWIHKVLKAMIKRNGFSPGHT
ncbi:hypothetical protein MMC10_002700 [Thelotrema lepadinum]|nr:hypothetical protein [Thelotrema lepadinum]